MRSRGLILGLGFCLLSTAGIATPVEDINKAAAPTATATQKVPLDELQQFTHVIDSIKNYYVTDVSDKSLLENAIRGMLEGLDPHSAYLDHEDFADLRANTSGKFGGLGIEVSLEDGFVRVVTPLDDTPAQKAGVKAGDLIIKLDDTPVKGLPLKKAIEMMRGKPGEPITLTILRTGEPKPLRITMQRDVILVKSVRSELLAPHFGLIRISQFQEKTGDNVRTALRNLQKESKTPLQGLILDLRNNPGGILDASVDVASTFLDSTQLKFDRVVVYTKGRLPGSDIKERAAGKDELQGAPLIVLVNGGSASASEIVAGALQDHHRGIVVGTTTFGKGSVQTVLPLKGERGLKLTTALYYTPSGRSIQATGIVPNVEVKELKIDSVSVNDNSLDIREADLTGHLSSSAATKNGPSSKGNEDLAKRDYQLNEALNLLKALSVAKAEN